MFLNIFKYYYLTITGKDGKNGKVPDGKSQDTIVPNDSVPDGKVQEKTDILGRFFPQTQLNTQDANEIKKEQERFEKEKKEKSEENEKSWKRMKIG